MRDTNNTHSHSGAHQRRHRQGGFGRPEHRHSEHGEMRGHGRGHGPFGHGGGGHPSGGMGGPRGRARRGEARYILLDALREGPKHGYEIIKALEDRSGGQYQPSPGTVYPTLQFLQETGLIQADQQGDRRVFRLTEAGEADLQIHVEDIADFWARFAAVAPSATGRHENEFLREEWETLTRTVWGGLREMLERDDTERVRAVRTALERCRNEIREIIVGGQSQGDNP